MIYCSYFPIQGHHFGLQGGRDNRNRPSQTGSIEVDKLEFYATENATNHWTDKYEQVSELKNPVLRRANTFYMAVDTKGRAVDFAKDVVKLSFEYGNYLESDFKSLFVVL